MDQFIHSMGPYNIIMGDFNNDIWATAPTRPWQEGLDDTSLLDPLLATPHHPDTGQYYTRIPRHGKPRKLDAILVRSKYLTYHGHPMTLSACPCLTMPSSCWDSNGVREATSPSHHRRSPPDPTPPPLSFPTPCPSLGGRGGPSLAQPKIFCCSSLFCCGKTTTQECCPPRMLLVSMCKSSKSSGAGPRKLTPSWSRRRSPHIGSPLNISYAEIFRFILQFLYLQMCVYGGSAVPQGGGTVTW